MVTKDLPTPHYYSDSGDPNVDSLDFDGAACAKMILEDPKVGAAGLDQMGLMESIQTHNTLPPGEMITDPNGLRGCLNAYRPSTFQGGFVVYSKDTFEEAAKKITYTLHRYEVATGTLVYSGGHWVVVKGVQTDIDPLTGDDYTIDGFWLHNPWPPDQFFSGPAANYWASIEEFETTWHTPNFFGAPWVNKFVNVCDPEVPKLGRLKPRKTPVPTKAGVLAPNDAFKIAGKALKTVLDEQIVEKNPLLKRHRPDEPFVVVGREDQAGEYFFPLRADEGVVAIARVDRRTGALRSLASFGEAVKQALPLSLEAIKKKVLGASHIEIRRVALRDGLITEARRRFRLTPDLGCICPTLWWQPCLESRSPLYPFYLLHLGRRTFYIRSMDGAIFDRVHVFPHGSAVGGV